jgi:hypothetical protein
MTPLPHLSAVAAALALLIVVPAQAASWTPLTSGGKPRVAEIQATSVFQIPASIAARGGTLTLTIVGAGEGGHSSKASCDDYAVQGGKGGDGGEVLEVTLNLQPGQCPAGLALGIGAPGRGAFRGGNSSAVGEPGGPTTVSCAGTNVASAMGGGRRADAFSAPRSSRGGSGGVVMNTLDQATGQTIDQRSTAITPGVEGQSGRGGYGSGGGGGGVSVVFSGAAVKSDGTVVRRSVSRNAPMGKGGYGAGTGAGPAEYASESSSYPAENAVQFGSGGGGGAAMCGIPASAREGGNGAAGFVRIQWND